MKIIDLLNRIAKGEEVPNKIEYRNRIFGYEDKDYYNSEVDYLFARYSIPIILNDEVEIIEEEKKIPKKICTNRIINTNDISEFEMIQNKINAEYTYTINEIIDYLDYLKSKGDNK